MQALALRVDPELQTTVAGAARAFLGAGLETRDHALESLGAIALRKASCSTACTRLRVASP